MAKMSKTKRVTVDALRESGKHLFAASKAIDGPKPGHARLHLIKAGLILIARAEEIRS